MHAVIIDSGVSDCQKHVNTIDVGCGTTDENGHGTQIVNVVSKIVPFAQLSSIRILNKNNECSLQDLIDALRACIDINADVLCISMTLESNYNSAELKRIVNQLANKNTIIVAPLHNRLSYGIPAVYKHVIGVQTAPTLPQKNRFYFNHSRIQARIPLVGIVCESINNSYRFFSGNSCACAFFFAELVSAMKVKNVDNIPNINCIYKNLMFSDTYIYRYLYSDDFAADDGSLDSIRHCIVNALAEQRQSLYNNNVLYDLISDITLFVNSLETSGLSINNSAFLRIDTLSSIDLLAKYLLMQNPSFSSKV